MFKSDHEHPVSTRFCLHVYRIMSEAAAQFLAKAKAQKLRAQGVAEPEPLHRAPSSPYIQGYTNHDAADFDRGEINRMSVVCKS